MRGKRDTEANRNKFGVAFAEILIEYLSIHRNVDVSNCNTLSKKEIAQEPINIYPNPVKRAERNLFISGIENLQSSYFLYTVAGKIIEFGEIDNNLIHFKNELNEHLYTLSIQNPNASTSFKLIVE